MTDDTQLPLSPSKRIRLRMRSDDLLVEGRRPVNPLVLAFYVLTCAGIAVYCVMRLKGFSPAPLLGGCLAVAYGLYILNMARFDTTLRLGATTDLEEVGVLSASRTQVRLDATASPTVGMRTLEDGDLYFLRLKVLEEPDLEIFKGHRSEDLHWLCGKIQEWRKG